MVHPDYQYDPRLVTPMAGMIASGVYEIVLGSRILGGGALRGGMPLCKYVANRFLTLFENLVLGAKLSEYHTGYRPFRARSWTRCRGRRTPTTSSSTTRSWRRRSSSASGSARSRCPTRYFPDASSIDFPRAVRYGAGVVGTTVLAFLARAGVYRHRLFATPARRPL